MGFRASYLFIVIAVAGLSCTSVKTMVDQSVDLSSYRYFHCLQCEDDFAEGFEDYDNAGTRELVRESIIEALMAKGLIYNEEEAQLYVDFKIIIEEQTAYMVEPDTQYNYWETYDAPRLQVKRGSLIINIIDVEKNQVVWQGIGSKMLEDDPEKAESAVPKTVNKILKKFKPTK